MCGITGIYRYDESHETDSFYLNMVNSLYHRGPDDGGFWVDGPFFLGHRRLSIIDLKTGRQPMASPDGTLVVTFNGEIYNYIELKKELIQKGRRFTTTSDTEVLLQGYKEWGTGLPDRLIGMFAFAIADRRNQTVFLARDRFGEKPLFLVETDDFVAFASELKTLTLLKGFERELDTGALYAYLCLNYVPGDQTLMRGVSSLTPGTWALFGPEGEKKQERFYRPGTQTPAGIPKEITLASAKSELLKRLDASLRITLRSDVPVGIFLSGGMDSSIIASRAVRMGQLNRAFCLTFGDPRFSELDKARYVADKLGIKLDTIRLEPKDIASFFALAAHADDPLADSSCLPVYVLSKFAAQTNKVVLGGDGGDELFAGYLTYKATFLHKMLTGLLPMWLRRSIASLAPLVPIHEGKVSFYYKLMRFLRAWDMPSRTAHLTWNGAWLPKTAAGFIHPGHFTGDRTPLETMLAHGRDDDGALTLSGLQEMDIRNYLVKDILTKVDRMSMAHGLEVRAPFLHPEIAEFGLGLDRRLKLSQGGRLKYILREIAADAFGRTFSAAGKQGFSIPIHAWLRNEGREIMTDLLSKASLDKVPELSPAPVRRAMKAHLDGKASLGFELWGLMTLVQWVHSRIRKQYTTGCTAPVRKLSLNEGGN